jgi:hypothetical protein
MTNVLVEVAMSYVRAAALEFTDEAALGELRDAFSSFISGTGPPDRVAAMLDHYINNRQPLERISAILQTCSEPPLETYHDYSADAPGQSRRKPRTWSAAEDIRLLAGIHRFGLENWGIVAGFVGNGRTRAQCAQRWVRGLDPRISKDQWSEEDDQRLIQLVREEGATGWSKIAAGIGNRSDVQCRDHFFQLQRDGKLPIDLVTIMPMDRMPRPAGIPLPPCHSALFAQQRPQLRLQRTRAHSSCGASGSAVFFPPFPAPPQGGPAKTPARPPFGLKQSLSQRRLSGTFKIDVGPEIAPDRHSNGSDGDVFVPGEALVPAGGGGADPIDWSVPSEDEGDDPAFKPGAGFGWF